MDQWQSGKFCSMNRIIGFETLYCGYFNNYLIFVSYEIKNYCELLLMIDIDDIDDWWLNPGAMVGWCFLK